MQEISYEQRQTRWAPLLAELVPVRRGGFVGVSKLLERFNEICPGYHRSKKWTESPSDYRPNSNQRGWLYDQMFERVIPGSSLIWWLGESLNNWLSWCNGLLALHAAHHFRDFVGVLGSMDQNVVVQHTEKVRTLLGMALIATYPNKLGRRLTDFMAVYKNGGNLSSETKKECERLRDRESARLSWARVLSSPLRQAIDDGRERWQKVRHRPKLARHLDTAYRMAGDRCLTAMQRVQLVNYYATIWLVEIAPKTREPLPCAGDRWDTLRILAANEARSATIMDAESAVSRALQDIEWWPATLKRVPGSPPLGVLH